MLMPVLRKRIVTNTQKSSMLESKLIIQPSTVQLPLTDKMRSRKYDLPQFGDHLVQIQNNLGTSQSYYQTTILQQSPLENA